MCRKTVDHETTDLCQRMRGPESTVPTRLTTRPTSAPIAPIDESKWWQCPQPGCGPAHGADGREVIVPGRDEWDVLLIDHMANASKGGRQNPYCYLMKLADYIRVGDIVRVIYTNTVPGIYRVSKVDRVNVWVEGYDYGFHMKKIQVCHTRLPIIPRWCPRRSTR
jgi:hypothetical protein